MYRQKNGYDCVNTAAGGASESEYRTHFFLCGTVCKKKGLNETNAVYT